MSNVIDITKRLQQAHQNRKIADVARKARNAKLRERMWTHVCPGHGLVTMDSDDQCPVCNQAQENG